jgi:cyanophycinase
MSEGVLALVGGAEWRDGCTFDRTLLSESGAQEVLVIPTAAAYEYPAKAVNWATQYFRELGVATKALDLLKRSDAFRTEIVDEIASATMIYLSGGSPFHLRSVIKQTPALDALVSFYRSGGFLAASSAGAMVLTDPMADPRGGALTVGLGLVSNLAFVPHFDTFSSETERRTISLAKGEIVVAGVDEETALIRRPGGLWSAEGKGAVSLFEDGAGIPLDNLDQRISVALHGELRVSH